MRKFKYFLFDNYDTQDVKAVYDDPRNIEASEFDNVLSFIADMDEGFVSYEELSYGFGNALIDRMVYLGILRVESANVKFDCPILLKEDAQVLNTCFDENVREIALALADHKQLLYDECLKAANGFDVKINMYHILCGMIFDGYFFQMLEREGVIAISRIHNSGLDYLNVIYEDCEELNRLSDLLLCSYNRFTDGRISLQSFGDSDGIRNDVFRFYKCVEQNNADKYFEEAYLLLKNNRKLNKKYVLNQAVRLCETGNCDEDVNHLLEIFGYTENGKICVPIYDKQTRNCIENIYRITEGSIGSKIKDALFKASSNVMLKSALYGVNSLEIANELYHILFGKINEELVKKGFVRRPARLTGEGRYLKCIEIK